MRAAKWYESQNSSDNRLQLRCIAVTTEYVRGAKPEACQDFEVQAWTAKFSAGGFIRLVAETWRSTLYTAVKR